MENRENEQYGPGFSFILDKEGGYGVLIKMGDLILMIFQALASYSARLHV